MRRGADCETDDDLRPVLVHLYGLCRLGDSKVAKLASSFSLTVDKRQCPYQTEESLAF